MFADQAVEVLLPIGAPQNVALAAATTSAAIDIATVLGMAAATDPLTGPFFILVSCTAAFTARAGAADPGVGLATDFPFSSNTVYRFKVVSATRFARFFSTVGGTLSYALSSR